MRRGWGNQSIDSGRMVWMLGCLGYCIGLSSGSSSLLNIIRVVTHIRVVYYLCTGTGTIPSPREGKCPSSAFGSCGRYRRRCPPLHPPLERRRARHWARIGRTNLVDSPGASMAGICKLNLAFLLLPCPVSAAERLFF